MLLLIYSIVQLGPKVHLVEDKRLSVVKLIAVQHVSCVPVAMTDTVWLVSVGPCKANILVARDTRIRSPLYGYPAGRIVIERRGDLFCHRC